MNAVEGALPVNFRDFGGQRSSLGGRVATGRLHRAGQLHALATEDFAAFSARDFRLIVDLRHAKERERDRVSWPRSSAPLELETEPGRDAPHLELLRQSDLTVAAIDRFYVDVYRWLPFEEAYRRHFVRAITALVDLEGAALFYCSAGKDRTGMLAALTLDLLGVHRDDVVADYLRSGEEARLTLERRIGRDVSHAIAAQWFGVRADYLETMFGEIRERCGSVSAYLADGGVDARAQERIRARWLVGS